MRLPYWLVEAHRKLDAPVVAASVAPTMTLDRMTQDGIKLTEYLCKHLGKRKVILVAHSFGTILGLRMIREKPDLFFAYVGTGQVADETQNYAMAYEALLKKAQSAPFLQKHPDQMLLWQFRVVSAISLDEPMKGYKAGQRLIAAGAADSTDPALQQLLGQLKNKGWLDKADATIRAKIDFPFRTWDLSSDCTNPQGELIAHGKRSIVTVPKSGSLIEINEVSGDIVEGLFPYLRATVDDTGGLRWEGYTYYGWTPARSYEIDIQDNTITIIVPRTGTDPKDCQQTWKLQLHK